MIISVDVRHAMLIHEDFAGALSPWTWYSIASLAAAVMLVRTRLSVRSRWQTDRVDLQDMLADL